MTVPRPRRTQEERSTATRALLLDATVDCLFELGYARTTTTEIVARAGLSRGAQLHHFPTKKQLVATAVERVLERRLEEFRAAAGTLDPTADLIRSVTDRLWAAVCGPPFYAWLELLVAARTDPELLAICTEIDRRFARQVRDTFRSIFGVALDARESPLDASPTFALLFLQGMALDRIINPDETKSAAMLKILRRTARQTFTPR